MEENCFDWCFRVYNPLPLTTNLVSGTSRNAKAVHDAKDPSTLYLRLRCIWKDDFCINHVRHRYDPDTQIDTIGKPHEHDHQFMSYASKISMTHFDLYDNGKVHVVIKSGIQRVIVNDTLTIEIDH